MCSVIVIASEAKQSPNKGGLLFDKTFCLKLVFALGIFFLNEAAFANSDPGDSLKGKYDINDPRNPDCPCHKYQRQADEEYRQLLKEENKVEGNLVANNPPSNNIISKRHYFSFSMFKLNLMSK